MSSSGVTTYSVTELEIIKGAAGKIGVAQDSQALSPSDVQVFRRNLNMIVKQWVAQSDFAPGLKMWTRRRAHLFLAEGQVKYSVGPTGDQCAAEDYVATTLASSLSGISATLTDATGVHVSDHIGVILDDGTLSWTTVDAVAGNVVTLAASITASAETVVFAYTSKPYKPFDIASASMHDFFGNDTPMDPNLSLDEYELIPSKLSLGTPSRIYFEPRKDAGIIYLDRSPDDLSLVIRLVFHSYIEDTTAQTQDVDFPAEWFRALVGQLAMDSALDFSRPVTPELVAFAKESLAMAKNAHPSNSTAYYLSDPDSYE